MVAVFLREPTLSPDDAVAAFAAANFRSAIDARVAAARSAGGVLIDDVDEPSARRVVDVLISRGRAAAVVEVDKLGLRPAVRTKELFTDALAFADSLGRRRPLDGPFLTLAAARVRVVGEVGAAAPPRPSGPSVLSTAASVVLPGAKTMMRAAAAMRGSGDRALGTALAESEQVYVDVVTAEHHLRLDESGVVLRAGGPANFAALCVAINAAVPREATRHRGFLALVAGEKVPQLRTLRELDRDITWQLWRAS